MTAVENRTDQSNEVEALDIYNTVSSWRCGETFNEKSLVHETDVKLAAVQITRVKFPVSFLGYCLRCEIL
jgi:hypothetical protein